MKERYRLFLRRKSIYYAFDNTTKTFESLKTKDKAEAERLLLAMNEAGKQPAMNLGLARVYLKHSDPMVTQRTWQHVLDEIIKLKTGPTQYRWQTAAKDKAFDLIRSRLLIETQSEHFLQVLKKGTVSTNAYLRKTHNFALDMNWLPACVIPRRQWPAIHFKEKRAITLAEHQQIIAAETNPERRNLYQLCWHLGASQGDIALLKGEDVDWTNNTVSFFRKKTGVPVLVHLGSDALNLLKDLPAEGPLFPYRAAINRNTASSVTGSPPSTRCNRSTSNTRNRGSAFICRLRFAIGHLPRTTLLPLAGRKKRPQVRSWRGIDGDGNDGADGEADARPATDRSRAC